MDIEHDLRTPLTVIIAGLCLLADHAETLTAEQQRGIAYRALQNSKLLAGRLDQLISKETGGLPSSLSAWARELLTDISAPDE